MSKKSESAQTDESAGLRNAICQPATMILGATGWDMDIFNPTAGICFFASFRATFPRHAGQRPGILTGRLRVKPAMTGEVKPAMTATEEIAGQARNDGGGQARNDDNGARNDGTAKEALAQISDKSSTLPFEVEDRQIIRIGINFDSSTRNIEGSRRLKSQDDCSRKKSSHHKQDGGGEG